jgi:hypothetical protein
VVRYEYLTLYATYNLSEAANGHAFTDFSDECLARINRAGAEGWQLKCKVTEFSWLLERQLP